MRQLLSRSFFSFILLFLSVFNVSSWNAHRRTSRCNLLHGFEDETCTYTHSSCAYASRPPSPPLSFSLFLPRNTQIRMFFRNTERVSPLFEARKSSTARRLSSRCGETEIGILRILSWSRGCPSDAAKSFDDRWYGI